MMDIELMKKLNERQENSYIRSRRKSNFKKDGKTLNYGIDYVCLVVVEKRSFCNFGL